MIAILEDRIIARLEALSEFKDVWPLGRKDPAGRRLQPPYAEVIFDGDLYPDKPNPRPVPALQFSVYVTVKNPKSSGAAARDAYGVIDMVRDDLNGRDFGLNIEPLRIASRAVTDYDQGAITYRLTFVTRVPLPLPQT